MSIAEVIGWKFNHQQGMSCKEIDGAMKIVEFPGGVPSQAEQDAWSAEYSVFKEKARIPRTVSMRQARLALLGAGLLPTINAAVAALTGAAGDAARIEWEYSGEVQRDKALVQSLALALGMTEKQLDDLFTAAAAL